MLSKEPKISSEKEVLKPNLTTLSALAIESVTIAAEHLLIEVTVSKL